MTKITWKCNFANTPSDVFLLTYVNTSVLYLLTVYKDELNKKPMKIDFAIIQPKKLHAISFCGESTPICFALFLIHHADFSCAMFWGVFPPHMQSPPISNHLTGFWWDLDSASTYPSQNPPFHPSIPWRLY